MRVRRSSGARPVQRPSRPKRVTVWLPGSQAYSAPSAGSIARPTRTRPISAGTQLALQGEVGAVVQHPARAGMVAQVDIAVVDVGGGDQQVAGGEGLAHGRSSSSG